MIDPSSVVAIRDSYDAIAVPYAERFRNELDAKPLDRRVLRRFAKTVADSGGGPVVDVGCGPGGVTRYLRDLGLDICGLDLSPEMVAVARRRHCDIRFKEGSMLSLDLQTGSIGGLVAWYSIIHLSKGQLDRVFAEFNRVLSTGAHVLISFQVGDSVLRRTAAFGQEISLNFRRWRPELIATLLARSSLLVTDCVVRGPCDAIGETTPQAYLMAQKHADAVDSTGKSSQ